MINPALAHLFEHWQLHLDVDDDVTEATAVFGNNTVEVTVTGRGYDADEALANVMGTINEAADALLSLP